MFQTISILRMLRLLQMFLSEHLPPVHLCCTKVHSQAQLRFRCVLRSAALRSVGPFFLNAAAVAAAAHILETLRVLVPRCCSTLHCVLRALALRHVVSQHEGSEQHVGAPHLLRFSNRRCAPRLIRSAAHFSFYQSNLSLRSSFLSSSLRS